MNPTRRLELASRIDHAVLAPSATAGDVSRAAELCVEHGVRGLCVAPRRAREGARCLAATAVRLVVVVGFPAAASRADIVRQEAEAAVEDGAAEIDAVLPWGLLREGAFAEAASELASLVAAVAPATVKAIVEASELDDDEIARIASDVVVAAGAPFLKTGTGVYGRPLTPERIRAIRDRMAPSLSLKVSGGLRDLSSARDALRAGADVLGTSRTFEILRSAGAET